MNKKPNRSQSPHETKGAYPLSVELEGKIYHTPREAFTDFNRMPADTVETYRQRYSGLLTMKIEAITNRVDEAMKALEKTERLVTSGNRVGLIDLLKPLEQEGIIKFIHTKTGGTYEPHPNIEKSKALAEAANAKRADIVSKIDQMKQDRAAKEKKQQEYEQVRKAGFEQTLPLGEKDRERQKARFAYQIRVEFIPGTNLKQIVVEEIMVKFSKPGVKIPKKGDTYLYGDRKTPVYLDKAADALDKKQPAAPKVDEGSAKEPSKPSDDLTVPLGEVVDLEAARKKIKKDHQEKEEKVSNA